MFDNSQGHSVAGLTCGDVAYLYDSDNRVVRAEWRDWGLGHLPDVYWWARTYNIPHLVYLRG